MGGPVGIPGDAHREAGHDDVAGQWGEEGEGAQGHHARAGALHLVVTGDRGQDGRRFARLHQEGGAPADQGQAGPVEERGRAAVELQGVGAVVEGDGARVQARLADGLGHRTGVPARVA